MALDPTAPASTTGVAPPRVPPRPKALSWLDDLGYFDDETKQMQRVLEYGFSGSGKTHFLGTWPGVCVIDTDKGGRTLRKMHVPFIPCYESKGIIDRVFAIINSALARSVLTDPTTGDVLLDWTKIETIGLDSITAFSNAALADLMLGAGKDPLETKAGYDEYGKLLNVQVELGKRLKRLSSIYNIIVTALPDINKDENLGTMMGGPLLVGSYRNTIMGDYDEVYYLEAEPQKDEKKFVLYTSKKQFFDAKSRNGLPYRIESPTYEKLVKLTV